MVIVMTLSLFAMKHHLECFVRQKIPTQIRRKEACLEKNSPLNANYVWYMYHCMCACKTWCQDEEGTGKHSSRFTHHQVGMRRCLDGLPCKRFWGNFEKQQRLYILYWDILYMYDSYMYIQYMYMYMYYIYILYIMYTV